MPVKRSQTRTAPGKPSQSRSSGNNAPKPQIGRVRVKKS